MKRIVYTLLLLLLIEFSVFSQGAHTDTLKFKKQLFFSFGMGISMSTTPSLNDYLRDAIPFQNTDSVKNFSVGIEFFGGVELQFSKRFSLKADYSYFFKGNTYNYPPFIYEINYHIHQPLIMGYYIFPGKGYSIKAGAGIGYSFARLSNIVSGSEINYSANGPGIRIESLFNMQLSKKMSSYLSGFFSANSISDLKDEHGNNLQDQKNHSNVNLHNLGFGLRLGVEIKLN